MGRFLRMYKVIGLALIFIGCKVSLPSQGQSVQASNYFLGNSDIISFKMDKLNNIYTIDKNSELIKYDNKGEVLFSYSNRTLGAIDYLDVSNPLKILAFFRDYQSIVFMDNTLSSTATYDLPDLGFQDISAIGLSNDNNIWLYDGLDSRLKKVNNDGKVLLESSLLSPYLKDLNPDFIVETNNYLLLNDPDKGVHLFDTFGKYINTALIPGNKDFQFIDNKIIFIENGVLQTWHVENYERQSIQSLVEAEKISAFHILKDKILVLQEGNILKFKREP